MIIVDQFTGRLMPGRRYSGVASGFEAKENAYGKMNPELTRKSQFKIISGFIKIGV